MMAGVNVEMGIRHGDTEHTGGLLTGEVLCGEKVFFIKVIHRFLES